MVLGLTATNALLKAAVDILRAGPEERWPFWLDAGLSPATMGYALALTLLAAIIVGLVPGLKIMGSTQQHQQDHVGHRQRPPRAGEYGCSWIGSTIPLQGQRRTHRAQQVPPRTTAPDAPNSPSCAYRGSSIPARRDQSPPRSHPGLRRCAPPCRSRTPRPLPPCPPGCVDSARNAGTSAKAMAG